MAIQVLEKVESYKVINMQEFHWRVLLEFTLVKAKKEKEAE